jgi:hypothetical protein
VAFLDDFSGDLSSGKRDDLPVALKELFNGWNGHVDGLVD